MGGGAGRVCESCARVRWHGSAVTKRLRKGEDGVREDVDQSEL
jgi:hypothetical protein